MEQSIKDQIVSKSEIYILQDLGIFERLEVTTNFDTFLPKLPSSGPDPVKVMHWSCPDKTNDFQDEWLSRQMTFKTFKIQDEWISKHDFQDKWLSK